VGQQRGTQKNHGFGVTGRYGSRPASPSSAPLCDHFRAMTALTCHGQPTHQLSPLLLSVSNDKPYPPSFPNGQEENFESYATHNALFCFSVAPDGATSSPFFASAESTVCPQHVQQEAGHIRHHLITGHKRIADTGSARNTLVLLLLTVRVISLFAYLSPCLSHKLTISLCRFVYCNMIQRSGNR